MSEKARGLVLDETGAVDPKLWRWFKRALSEGRINEGNVKLSEQEKANNSRESWRYLMILKARDEIEDLRWHLEGRS